MNLDKFFTSHNRKRHQAFRTNTMPPVPLTPIFDTEIELVQWLKLNGIDISKYDGKSVAGSKIWYENMIIWRKK